MVINSINTRTSRKSLVAVAQSSAAKLVNTRQTINVVLDPLMKDCLTYIKQQSNNLEEQPLNIGSMGTIRNQEAFVYSLHLVFNLVEAFDGFSHRGKKNKKKWLQRAITFSRGDEVEWFDIDMQSNERVEKADTWPTHFELTYQQQKMMKTLTELFEPSYQSALVEHIIATAATILMTYSEGFKLDAPIKPVTQPLLKVVRTRGRDDGNNP